MGSDLLRAVIHDPDTLAEFDRLEARAKVVARRLPWADDDFNELCAINRQLVALATAKGKDAAA